MTTREIGLSAGLLLRGRFLEVADSYTLIPLDRPTNLARIIREFTHEPGKPTHLRDTLGDRNAGIPGQL